MSELCTACGLSGEVHNTIVVERYAEPPGMQQLLATMSQRAAKKRRVGLAPDGSALGLRYRFNGLCDACALKVVEYVRSLRDFTAK